MSRDESSSSSSSSSAAQPLPAPSVPVSASNPGSLLAAARRSTEGEKRLTLLRQQNKKEQDSEDAERVRRVTKLIEQKQKQRAAGGDKEEEDDDDDDDDDEDDDDAQAMKHDRLVQKVAESAAPPPARASSAGTRPSRASVGGGGPSDDGGSGGNKSTSSLQAQQQQQNPLSSLHSHAAAAALPPHSTLLAPLLHKSFMSEVSKWESLGGPGLPLKSRDAFASDLNFRYLCGPAGLDHLPKSAVVTRVRRAVVAVIEQVVSGDVLNVPAAKSDSPTGGGKSKKQHQQPRRNGGQELWDEGAPLDAGADWERRADEEIKRGERAAAAAAADNGDDDYADDGGEQPPTVAGVRHLLDEDGELHKEVEARQLKEKEKEYKMRPSAMREPPNKGWNNAPVLKVPRGPWNCSLCGKGNEKDDDKCKVCGRARNFTTKEEAAKKEKENAAAKADNPEDAKKKWKDENDKFKAINDDYLKFIKMKTKTDADAVARAELAGDIDKILQSLRLPNNSGGLGPLSDSVAAPTPVKQDQWRLHNPTNRTDGRDLDDVLQEPWKPKEGLELKIKREAFKSEVAAGGEFASNAVKEAEKAKELSQATLKKKFAYL